jgi:glucose-1-phosphate adenylyltransferase
MGALNKKTLTFILAGGQGERLYPLTRDRSKPAVHFGGTYRIIDFPLSNCLNSDMRKIIVLTQYKSLSLERHISTAWNLFHRELGAFIDVVPPQQRITDDWYRGTADAIFQNIYIIEMEKPEYVIILSGDHIYKMDYNRMLHFHIENNADLTIAAIETPLDEAKRFGVLEVDKSQRLIGFEEKPDSPRPIPGKMDSAFVSMGLYCFKTEKLVTYLSQDHKLEGSHDFGKDVIPRIFKDDRVFTYDYVENEGDRAYWRDIGTIKSYYEANMELLTENPPIDLYERGWIIRTYMEQFPPAKILSEDNNSFTKVINSIASNGAVVNSGSALHSILSPGVRVQGNAVVENSILMHGVTVGKNAKIKNSIIDKRIKVPENEEIGYDLDKDRKRFTVTEEDIVVVPKEFVF